MGATVLVVYCMSTRGAEVLDDEMEFIYLLPERKILDYLLYCLSKPLWPMLDVQKVV